MRKALKERNLKILTRHHELTLSTKKQVKEIYIEISEEMKVTIPVVKRVIERHYNQFLSEIGAKNTCLEGLTSLREKFKYENYTDKQIEYMVLKIFGNSDTKATSKAGYKSKSSITNLKNNLNLQMTIESERQSIIKNSKFGFNFIYETLGEIAIKSKETMKERSVTDKQGGKNGAELSKTIAEKHMFGDSISAFNLMNKMAGFYYEDRIKAGKLLVDIEKLELEIKRCKSETEMEILKANIEVLKLEIETGNTEIEDDVKDIQEDLQTWTQEAWKDEKKTH